MSMKHSRAARRFFTGATLAAGALLAHGAQAGDSLKLYWDVNGHYYQRFETAGILWSDAKVACENKSGHLATITSQEEQGFIQSHLLTPSWPPKWYHIGATDSASQNNWKWVTGEPWSYENWASGWNEPNNRTGEDYLAIFTHQNYFGQWADVYADALDIGYICEWSTQNYIDTGLVPDLNGNGVDEIAGLFVNYVTGDHTVQIKDPATDKIVKTLTFAKKTFKPPQGLVVLEDINGNGVPEIGVLFANVGYPHVQIKDALDNGVILKSIDFFTGFNKNLYKPRAVNSSPDVNGNGASEIVVIGVHTKTGKALAEIRDSKTKLKSRDTPF